MLSSKMQRDTKIRRKKENSCLLCSSIPSSPSQTYNRFSELGVLHVSFPESKQSYGSQSYNDNELAVLRMYQNFVFFFNKSFQLSTDTYPPRIKADRRIHTYWSMDCNFLITVAFAMVGYWVCSLCSTSFAYVGFQFSYHYKFQLVHQCNHLSSKVCGDTFMDLCSSRVVNSMR